MDKKTYLSIRRELSFEPTPWPLGKHLLQDLALGGVVAWLISGKSLPGYIASQALLACLYFRAFSLMHDAVHGALSRNRRLNDCLGILYGGICFLPFATWRTVHLDHHSWAGNAEKDPVMRIVREFPGKSERRKNIDTHLWRSWIPYLAFLQQVVFWSASVKILLARGREKGGAGQLAASVVAPLTVLLGLLWIGRAHGSAFLFLPSIAAYLALVEVINFPHHLNLPRVDGEGKLNLWEQFKISRTCVYSPWFSRLVLLNFNFHAEHHMFPTLPWHELPKAHEKVRAANPVGYHLAHGHEWIKENRRKDLREVFAPTELLHPAENKEPKAA